MELNIEFRRDNSIGERPEDWQIETLGAVSDMYSGTTPLRGKEQLYFEGGDHLWVKTKDLTNSLLRDTGEQVTDAALEETSLSIQPPGTVLVAMYGGFNQIGRTGLLEVPATVNQAITAIRVDEEYLIPEYLLHYLNFKVDYWRSVAGSSRKDPNITKQDVEEFPVALPPLKEQRAIAKVLAEVDELIASLDALIEKKGEVKRATLRELISGERRLSGHTESWEKKRFGEVVTLVSEQASPHGKNIQDFCVELEHIGQGTGRLNGSAQTSEKSSLKTKFVERDVLFSKLRPYLRKYWMADREGVCSTEIWIFRADQSVILPEYLYQVVQTEEFVRRANESHGTHMPRADWDVVKDYRFDLPPLHEQQAIAEVLSDMDAEVDALERHRDKTKAVKKGMMQELLTGKTRLLEKSASAPLPL